MNPDIKVRGPFMKGRFQPWAWADLNGGRGCLHAARDAWDRRQGVVTEGERGQDFEKHFVLRVCQLQHTRNLGGGYGSCIADQDYGHSLIEGSDLENSLSPPSAIELRIRSLECISSNDALSNEGITETGSAPNSQIARRGCILSPSSLCDSS